MLLFVFKCRMTHLRHSYFHGCSGSFPNAVVSRFNLTVDLWVCSSIRAICRERDCKSPRNAICSVGVAFLSSLINKYQTVVRFPFIISLMNERSHDNNSRI